MERQRRESQQLLKINSNKKNRLVTPAFFINAKLFPSYTRGGHAYGRPSYITLAKNKYAQPPKYPFIKGEKNNETYAWPLTVNGSKRSSLETGRMDLGL